MTELIDSCEHRIHYVRELLEDIEPNLVFDVLPIYDIYGPTKEDPSFEVVEKIKLFYFLNITFHLFFNRVLFSLLRKI